jgi:hypothetical protein
MQDYVSVVCMECREPRHNRHTVSLMAGHVVISPKVRQTRGARRAGIGLKWGTRKY